MAEDLDPDKCIEKAEEVAAGIQAKLDYLRIMTIKNISRHRTLTPEEIKAEYEERLRRPNGNRDRD